jgi:hypothetical protein
MSIGAKMASKIVRDEARNEKKQKVCEPQKAMKPWNRSFTFISALVR